MTKVESFLVKHLERPSKACRLLKQMGIRGCVLTFLAWCLVLASTMGLVLLTAAVVVVPFRPLSQVWNSLAHPQTGEAVIAAAVIAFVSSILALLYALLLGDLVASLLLKILEPAAE